jgi:ribosomal-protein-alanine N-acetyltransferase
LVAGGDGRAYNQFIDPNARGAGSSERPVAGFVLSRLAADESEILTIAVDAAQQGRGVGRALLSENLRQAANAGAKAMFLEVAKDNAPALALYERFGFVKVGERAGYYRRADGTRATGVVMRKSLG